MVDKMRQKNFTLDIEAAEILVTWSSKEMRTPAMQLRWLIMKYAPSALKAPSTVMEAAAKFVKDTRNPPLAIAEKGTTVLPVLKGSTATRTAVVRFHENKDRSNRKIAISEDGWQRRIQKRGHAKYTKQRLRDSSLMYRVLVVLEAWGGGDLSNFELADLDGKSDFESYAKVTSCGWNGGLIERKSVLHPDRRGYFTYRLLPYGKKVLERARRQEGAA